MSPIFLLLHLSTWQWCFQEASLWTSFYWPGVSVVVSLLMASLQTLEWCCWRRYWRSQSIQLRTSLTEEWSQWQLREEITISICYKHLRTQSTSSWLKSLHKILEEGVQSAGTHVYLTNDLWPDQAALGSWYYSKEKLEGKNPFHGGWIINKKWPLKDKLNQHILLYNQVNNWCLSQLGFHKFSLKQILS